MGNCFSNGENTITSINRVNNPNAISSERTKPKLSNRTSKNMINMSDFMGIKKSDSIDNFYRTRDILGRGAFGEVVRAEHLFSNEVRAIKMIDKRKLSKHSILMAL